MWQHEPLQAPCRWRWAAAADLPSGSSQQRAGGRRRRHCDSAAVHGDVLVDTEVTDTMIDTASVPAAASCACWAYLGTILLKMLQ